MDDINKMLVDMKAVTTPQQAAAYSEKFKADLPRVEKNVKTYLAALEHHGYATHTGTKTPEMAQGEAMLKELETKGPAIEAEMARISNLNPGIKTHFDKYRALHD